MPSDTAAVMIAVASVNNKIINAPNISIKSKDIIRTTLTVSRARLIPVLIFTMMAALLLSK